MRPTRAGLAVFAVFIAGVLLAVFAHGKVAGFGIVVAALIVLLVFAEGMGSGGPADYGRKGEVLRQQAEQVRRARFTRWPKRRE